MIGYQYFRSDGFVWRKHQSALTPLSMPHRRANVNLIRALLLLVSHGAALIRWESNFDCGMPTEWWHVIKSGEAHLKDLSSSTRSKVRRGLRQFDVAPLDRTHLQEEGHGVYWAAYDRYETFEPRMSKAAFERAIRDLPPETEFWGVRDRETGKLVAFSENLVMDQACFYLTIWLDPAFFKHYSSYALIHRMNEHYLNERGMQYVSDGARSISHDTRIHDFLIRRFGFRKAFARLHVVYFPLLAPIVLALYPFRRQVQQAKGASFRKASVLLEQERIRRSFAGGDAPGSGAEMKLSRRSARFLKRTLDILVSLAGLSLVWWIILIAWVAASLDTGKNGFFTQRRIGMGGKPFKLVKIRTMREDSRVTTTVTQINDPRITRLGHLLRRTKVDELPQLWNVLIGDMSLVGPRPDVAGFADTLGGEQRLLLTVRPGITGPATLKYRHEEQLLSRHPNPETYNRDVIWPDKVRINLRYMKNWSFLKDMKYLWRTLLNG